MAKKAAKKKAVPKEGIFLFKNSKGFGFRVKQNQHVLATAQGYNTRQNALKGMFALNRMLNDHFDHFDQKYVNIIDLTKK